MVGKVHGVLIISIGLAGPSRRTNIFYGNVSEDFFPCLHLLGYIVRFEGDNKPGVRQRLRFFIAAADKQRERGGQRGGRESMCGGLVLPTRSNAILN
jgi:hypothetical protein